MNVSTFFKHWDIRENPFMAEEARQDDVFARLHQASAHPDFPKLLGDLNRPASAVVFGEKGSGKTAIRLQIQEQIETFNADHPNQKTLIIAYDDLNPVLDRFARHLKGKTPLENLEQFRLIDHIDGILSVIIPDIVTTLCDQSAEPPVELGVDARKISRQLDAAIVQDVIILQTLYDQQELATDRHKRLRRSIRYRGRSWVGVTRFFAAILTTATAVTGGYFFLFKPEENQWIWILSLVLAGTCAVALLAKAFGNWFGHQRLAKQLHRQMRVLDRSVASFRHALERLPKRMIAGTSWPVDDLDDPRYLMLDRLRRVVKPFGFESVVVLLDRLDEPTLINGETDRMKAVIWPVFNNKFLQQSNIAFKMLLPLELLHELRKQSSDFFQEARLDKQNLVERLNWTGSTLYDMCNARLNACRPVDAAPLSIASLFEESVTRQDLVDALDQMRQPRDAFKLLYQVIQNHCASTTEEEEHWEVPRLILDQVRRVQADRVEELHRGLRPA